MSSLKDSVTAKRKEAEIKRAEKKRLGKKLYRQYDGIVRAALNEVGDLMFGKKFGLFPKWQIKAEITPGLEFFGTLVSWRVFLRDEEFVVLRNVVTVSINSADPSRFHVSLSIESHPDYVSGGASTKDLTKKSLKEAIKKTFKVS